MAPTKKSNKEEFGVKSIGPIYPVFKEKKVKVGAKSITKLTLDEQWIWVQWKSNKKIQEWTAEPLSSFSGAAKQKALKVLEKKQCWPWVSPKEIDALRASGFKKYEEKKTYELINNLKPREATEEAEEVEEVEEEEDEV